MASACRWRSTTAGSRPPRWRRLRGKLAYRPVVFEVLPETFTLSRLQQVVEALAGQVLHKQNFRRLVASANLVEPTGEWDQRTGGRPAELYRFRREVLRERPAPGLGLRRLGGPSGTLRALAAPFGPNTPDLGAIRRIGRASGQDLHQTTTKCA